MTAKLMKMPMFSRMVAQEIVAPFKEEPFITLKVKEFLFDGYYVEFMKAISELKGETVSYVT